MSVEIKGLEHCIDMLDRTASPAQIEHLLDIACLMVERRAKELAPKGRTGELRNSISYRVEGDVGIVYNPLEYAPYVEWGTGLFSKHPMGGRQDVPWRYQDEKGEWYTTYGMEPQPFLRPALDENREEIMRLFREGITNND